MRTMIIRNGGNVLSAFCGSREEGGCEDRAGNCIKSGVRIRFVYAVDVGFSIVEKGEEGTVEGLPGAWGEVYLHLDVHHKGLIPYSNCIVLMPFVNTETLEALEVIG